MRLSISNVLLLMLAICVGLGWYVDRQRSNDVRIAIETEREELWRQLRERTQVAQTYKSSIARRQSTAIELGVFKELSEVRSVEIDVFLDCHRRHIQATIAAKDAELKLLSQDGSSAAKESYIRLQSEFFEQAASEMRKLVESSQMQLFEDVEKSQAMEQLLYYEQCLANCETLLLADSTALE